MSKVDREHKIFSNMFVPQIQIWIEAVSKNTETETELANFKRDEENPTSWIFTEKISNIPNQTVINVIIEDINDHEPVFERQSPVVIGYPNPKISKNFAPPYLIQVKVNIIL